MSDEMSIADLIELRDETKAALLAALRRGQSYTISNRSKTRVSVTELRSMLAQFNAEIKARQGRKITYMVPNV